MNRKKSGFNIFFYILSILSFMVIGMYMGSLLKDEENDFLFIIMLISCYILYVVSIIVHELGHMVFGLLSGYTFSSFRVYNLMILNDNGKYVFKKMSIAGTAGQCIMLPKEKNESFVLYNLGGIIFNFIFFVISLFLLFIFDNNVIKILLFEFAIMNLYNTIVNGIPYKASINNDMLNIISFKKDKRNLDNYFNTLYIQNAIILGKRLKDISKKYIYKPDKIETDGDIAQMVFYCNQLMDKCKFKEAIVEIESIVNNDKLNIIYNSLLINDLLYCYVILDKDPTNIILMEDYSIKNVLRQMKTNPSVIRTNYTRELLINKNKEKANEWYNSFNKIKKTYPYQIEIESEEELIEIANKKYQEKDQ